MTPTTIAIIVVVSLVVLTLLVWFLNTPASTITRWVPLTPDALAPHVQWVVGSTATPGPLLLYRPWTGLGSGMAEYFGIQQLVAGQKLELSIATPPMYWEYDIYAYPSWELKATIPRQVRAIIGGRDHPLPPGAYFIALRTTHDFQPSPIKREGVAAHTSNHMRCTTQIQLDSVNDEAEFDSVATTQASIDARLTTSGWMLVESTKSTELEHRPLTPHVRCEHINITVPAGGLLMVLYPERSVAHFTTFTAVNDHVSQIIAPQTTRGTGTIRSHLQEFTRSTRITIRQYVYGITTTSLLLPLYAYVYITARSNDPR